MGASSYSLLDPDQLSLGNRHRFRQAQLNKPDIGETEESALLWLAALGGGPAMYAAMRIIRHKTLHKKFMVGIPVIVLLELLAAFLLCRFLL